MVKCHILKNFMFSKNGIHAQEAVAGHNVDIPDHLVPGLAKEGFVSFDAPVPVLPTGAENKMLPEAGETKPSTAKGPGGRWYLMDGETRVSKGFLTKEEAEASA